MINLRSLLFYLVILDFSLIPMCHIFGIPFKVGLITLGIVGLFTWNRKPISDLFLYFCGLIIACWIGVVYQSLLYPVSTINFSIYCSSSIFLGFLGFLFGFFMLPKDLNKILHVTLAVMLMNILIGYFWNMVPALVNFYHLQEYRQSGLLIDRNTGIFQNPNVSSLEINILLIFIVLANEQGLFRGNKRNLNIYVAVILIMALITLITMGSKSEFISYAIIAFYFILKQALRLKKRTLIIGATCIIILLSSSLFLLQKSAFGPGSFSNGLYILTHLPSEIYSNYLAPDLDYNNRGDRRVKYLLASEAFSHSPIWGSGFDRADIGIFSLQSKIGFHSDWSYILVAGGIVAFIFLILILWRVGTTHPLLIIPFILPGMTNSFMLTVQLFALYGIFWGILERNRTVSVNSKSSPEVMEV